MGCDSTKTVLISIASNLLPNGLIDMRIEEGISNVMFNKQFDDLVNEQINQEIEVGTSTMNFTELIELETPETPPNVTMPKISAQYQGELPYSVQLDTVIWYDNSLLGYFENKTNTTVEWLTKVVMLTKPRLSHSQLRVKINLNVVKFSHINKTIKSSHEMMRALENDTDISKNYLNSVFCLDLNATGIKGISSPGTACRRDGYANNINELWTEEESELSTARVFVHEIAHNLGM